MPKLSATQSILLTYCDRLAPFGHWYRQLWAESLGKHGKCTTPVPAQGTVDQHSQLQLYLDGPKDKLFTLLTLESNAPGPRIAQSPNDDAELAYLGRRNLGELFDAAAEATAGALIARGRPLRRIALGRLDEEALGALFMHFMLETVLAAALMGLDPFGQPAVEEIKIRLKAALAPLRAIGTGT